MAVPSNTSLTYTRVGIREDLSDLITNISRTETPFVSSISDGAMAKNTFVEWQTDTLATPSGTNAALEGDDASIISASPTTRLGNYCQILVKAVSTSGTASAVTTAGRAEEHSYQVVKKVKELKRDLEARMSGNYARNAGAAGTAREMASVESTMTNSSRGAGGANPASILVNAATDGTQRALTEAMLRDVQKQCWQAGGTPDMLMVGPFNKGVVSGFAGIATKYRESTGMKQGVILGAADIYIGEFGTIKVVPSYISRDRTAILYDPSTFKKRWLRKTKRIPLAKTGDSDKSEIVMEVSLESSAPASNGVVADLTTS